LDRLFPYSPLGRGFLTGTVDENTKFDPSDIRSRNPRFTPEAIKANRALIAVMDRSGSKSARPPAQLALACCSRRSRGSADSRQPKD